jgi:NADH-quinone oxidoreductase subunit N
MSADLLRVLAPYLPLALGVAVSLAAEPFLRASAKHRVLPWLTSILVLVAIGIEVLLSGGTVGLGGMIATDPVRSHLQLAILVAALCGIAGLQQSLGRDGHGHGESYALILAASLGSMVMVGATTTIALFCGIELASLAIYVLVALRRDASVSGEALLKYLVMGAVFSAILLYGAALLYGATGSVAYGAPVLPGKEGVHRLGAALLLIGLLFKVGSVPFHFWTADAYSAAPVAVTGFMAAAMKIGGFAALGAIWLNLLAPGRPLLGLGESVTAMPGTNIGALDAILGFCAVLSIILGNFSGLGQRGVRRTLAFSAVAQAGFMLLAFKLPAAGHLFSLSSLWLYVVAYAIAAAGAGACLSVLCAAGDGDRYSQLAGSARRHPYIGLLTTILVASLAGIPPTAGFLGKFQVLGGLVSKDGTLLALIAILAAVVGAAFYLRIIMTIWQPAEEPREGDAETGNLSAAMATAAAAIVVLLLLRPGLVTGEATPVAQQAIVPASQPAVAVREGQR